MPERRTIDVTDEPPPVPDSIAPIQVAMTDRREGGPLVQRVELATAAHQPNVIAVIVAPAVSLAIRFAYSYGTALLGLLMASAATDKIMPAADVAHRFYTCANLAVWGPALGLLKDLVTIFGDLEKKYPLWTGKV